MRCSLMMLAVAAIVQAAEFHPVIPRTWDDAAMTTLELPNARPKYSLRFVSADYYYRIPVRPVFRSYPVYPIGKEPPGYLDKLRQVQPVVEFEPAKLKSREDWIRAGELVFDSPITFEAPIRTEDVRDPAFLSRTGVPLAPDGSIPTLRYVVRNKGEVELGSFSCGMCHTRIQPNGSIIKGAQGNFPGDRVVAFDYRKRAATNRVVVDKERAFDARATFGVPWGDPDPRYQKWFEAPLEEHLGAYDAIPPGVFARHRSSVFAPPALPDLIGIKERHYLDKAGLQNHRGIEDLMRYAALNQGADDIGDYAGFIPATTDFQTPVDPSTQSRYSDEQLYALALYLYSLQPPPNPNKPSALTERGRKVFLAQGCVACHAPPAYTNNKLLPAPDFQTPAEHRTKFDIMDIPIGTDPTLTMQTRRGTGYYKVPSLRGVWYRGPFEHNGSVATLEDWFDPRRLREEYVPTGWRGYGVTSRAVKGHEFGLKLNAEDKEALIAFLKTL